jgi:hypothetical protein
MRALYMISQEQVLEGIVLAEHSGPDGRTVDLAKSADDPPFVCRAPVAEQPVPGHAVFVVDEEQADEGVKPRRRRS